MQTVIKDFTEGEYKHTIKVCNSCQQLRPVFHLTTPSTAFKDNAKPREQPQWDIFENGRCSSCKKEHIKNNNRNKAILFSGHFSPPEDCFFDNESQIHFNNNNLIF